MYKFILFLMFFENITPSGNGQTPEQEKCKQFRPPKSVDSENCSRPMMFFIIVEFTFPAKIHFFNNQEFTTVLRSPKVATKVSASMCDDFPPPQKIQYLPRAKKYGPSVITLTRGELYRSGRCFGCRSPA